MVTINPLENYGGFQTKQDTATNILQDIQEKAKKKKKKKSSGSSSNIPAGQYSTPATPAPVQTVQQQKPTSTVTSASTPSYKDIIKQVKYQGVTATAKGIYNKYMQERAEKKRRQLEEESRNLEQGYKEYYGGAPINSLEPYQQRGTAQVTNVRQYSDKELLLYGSAGEETYVNRKQKELNDTILVQQIEHDKYADSINNNENIDYDTRKELIEADYNRRLKVIEAKTQTFEGEVKKFRTKQTIISTVEDVPKDVTLGIFTGGIFAGVKTAKKTKRLASTISLLGASGLTASSALTIEKQLKQKDIAGAGKTGVSLLSFGGGALLGGSLVNRVKAGGLADSELLGAKVKTKTKTLKRTDLKTQLPDAVFLNTKRAQISIIEKEVIPRSTKTKIPKTKGIFLEVGGSTGNKGGAIRKGRVSSGDKEIGLFERLEYSVNDGKSKGAIQTITGKVKKNKLKPQKETLTYVESETTSRKKTKGLEVFGTETEVRSLGTKKINKIPKFEPENIYKEGRKAKKTGTTETVNIFAELDKQARLYSLEDRKSGVRIPNIYEQKKTEIGQSIGLFEPVTPKTPKKSSSPILSIYDDLPTEKPKQNKPASNKEPKSIYDNGLMQEQKPASRSKSAYEGLGLYEKTGIDETLLSIAREQTAKNIYKDLPKSILAPIYQRKQGSRLRIINESGSLFDVGIAEKNKIRPRSAQDIIPIVIEKPHPPKIKHPQIINPNPININEIINGEGGGGEAGGSILGLDFGGSRGRRGRPINIGKGEPLYQASAGSALLGIEQKATRKQAGLLAKRKYTGGELRPVLRF